MSLKLLSWWKKYISGIYISNVFLPVCVTGLSGAMASISMRSGAPGSPTHLSASSAPSRRRNGLHDVDLNTFIAEEMALHLDNGTRKRSSAQCNDVITDSPTHKRNRMIWALKKKKTTTTAKKNATPQSSSHLYSDQEIKSANNSAHHSPAHSLIGLQSPVEVIGGGRGTVFSAEA